MPTQQATGTLPVKRSLPATTGTGQMQRRYGLRSRTVALRAHGGTFSDTEALAQRAANRKASRTG